MLRKKYHLVVFREDHGSCRHLHVRGWLLPAAGLLLALMTASLLLFWWQSRNEESNLIRQVIGQDRDAVLRDALLMQVSTVRNLAGRMDRILLLNTKLSLMFGNPSEEDFERAASMGLKYSQDRLEDVALYTPRQVGRTLNRLLNEMGDELYLEEVRQQDIFVAVRQQSPKVIQELPSIWPVRGRFTSPFGVRRHPISGRRIMHKGIDIAAPTGTPIVAPASGKVVFAKRFSGYGLTIEIEHRPGLRTRYAHCSSIAVKPGDTVKRGQLIGRVGATGRTTGSHLHYEVHVRGQVVNPLIYILN
ncbi:M23 family metallopeptidase [Megalodesulfovibrio paquesii]